MLRTNLSTRPFYNVRAVRMALGLAALAVAALTVLNVARVVSLRASEGTLSARATGALNEANRLRAEALRIRAQVDPREVEAIAIAAADANEVIEQRAFSWSRFLTELEATLPPDVRVTSLQPSIDGGDVQVSMSVQARRAVDLARFMDALENESTFRDVLPSDQRYDEDGIIDARIVAAYIPPELAERPQAAAGGNGAQP